MTKKPETKIEYYGNGEIKKVYQLDEKGQKQGAYEEYYENGKLKRKDIFKDGKEMGPYEEYYKNGQLKIKCDHATWADSQTPYTNGYTDKYETIFFNGSYEEYDEMGRLIKKGKWYR